MNGDERNVPDSENGEEQGCSNLTYKSKEIMKRTEKSSQKKEQAHEPEEDLYDITNWTERPYSRNFFGDTPDGSFDGMSFAEKERYIVEDIINCMIGCHGNYIGAVCGADGKKSFHFPPPKDTCLEGLVNIVKPVVVLYSDVSQFIEEHRHTKYGRVNQALSYTLWNVINDYYRPTVAKIETELIEGSMSVHKLIYYVQRPIQLLEFLNGVIEKIEKRKARGGVTLSILHKEFNWSPARYSMRELVEKIMSNSCIPYFESLDKWIRMGYIFDPRNEFMIEDNKEMENDKYKLSSDGIYWKRRYTIREQEVPSFLEEWKEMVLRSGKYLNIIKQCDRAKFDKIISDNMQGAEITYARVFDDSYMNAIETPYKRAGKELLDLIVNDCSIMERLRSLKRYLLMEQGDFVVTFMDLCDEELSKPLGDVIPSRLTSLFEYSLSLSSVGRVDQYKEDIKAHLVRYDLLSQVNKVQQFSDSGADETLQDNSILETMTGYDAFTLSLISTWPVSLIVDETMRFYQMIFRLLLKFKRVERELCRVWLCDKRFKTLEPRNAKYYRKAFLLRHQMISYIRSFLCCITEGIIECNWLRFIDAKNKAENVDDFKHHHSQFVENCLKELGLDKPIFMSKVFGLLKVCLDFCNFIQSHYQEVESNKKVGLTQTFEQHINIFEENLAEQWKSITFSGFLRLLRH